MIQTVLLFRLSPYKKGLFYIDKKDNQIFLIYKEIQSGAVAKSYMRKGFLLYEEQRKNFPIYEEAVSHIRLCYCSILNFLIYEENLIFFLSVYSISQSRLFKNKKEKRILILNLKTLLQLYLRIDDEGEPWSWLYDLLHGAPHLPRHEAEDCKDDQAGEDANTDTFKYSFHPGITL